MLLPGRNEFRPSGREPIAGLLRLRLGSHAPNHGAVRCPRLETAPVVLKTKTPLASGLEFELRDANYIVGKLTTLATRGPFRALEHGGDQPLLYREESRGTESEEEA